MSIICDQAWLPTSPCGSKWPLPPHRPHLEDSAGCSGGHKSESITGGEGWERAEGKGREGRASRDDCSELQLPHPSSGDSGPCQRQRGASHAASQGQGSNAWAGCTFSAPPPCLCSLVGDVQLQALRIVLKDVYSMCLQVHLWGKKEAFTLLLAQVTGISAVTWVPALWLAAASRVEPHS